MVSSIDLEKKHCVPCEGGQPPLFKKDAELLLSELTTKWQIVESSALRQEFIFKDFKEALAFVDKIGVIAEEEGHHPDIELHYGRVVVELSTHAIGGLSQNDFILARKIELIQQ